MRSEGSPGFPHPPAHWKLGAKPPDPLPEGGTGHAGRDLELRPPRPPVRGGNHPEPCSPGSGGARPPVRGGNLELAERLEVIVAPKHYRFRGGNLELAERLEGCVPQTHCQRREPLAAKTWNSRAGPRPPARGGNHWRPRPGIRGRAQTPCQRGGTTGGRDLEFAGGPRPLARGGTSSSRSDWRAVCPRPPARGGTSLDSPFIGGGRGQAPGTDETTERAQQEHGGR